MQAKISDFGLAKEQPSIPDGKSYVKVESMRGSRGYETDEYYDGQLSTKLDVFSFGVVSASYCVYVYVYVCEDYDKNKYKYRWL